MDLSTLPAPIQNVLGALLQAVPVSLPGGFAFSYLQAGLIVILLFFLIYTLGHLRHTYVGWSVKGILPGLTFGFILAIIVEGLFVIGGKTVFTEVLGWKNAPKPISTVIDGGREKLVEVLGVKSEIPNSQASEPEDSEALMSRINQMNEKERTKLQNAFCNPN